MKAGDRHGGYAFAIGEWGVLENDISGLSGHHMHEMKGTAKGGVFYLRVAAPAPDLDRMMRHNSRWLEPYCWMIVHVYCMDYGAYNPR